MALRRGASQIARLVASEASSATVEGSSNVKNVFSRGMQRRNMGGHNTDKHGYFPDNAPSVVPKYGKFCYGLCLL